MTTQQSIYDTVQDAVTGESIEDVIDLFAYMLADAIAQCSDYQPDKDLFLEGGNAYSEAYKFICTNEATDTIQTH